MVDDAALKKFLVEVQKGFLAYTDLMTDEEAAVAKMAVDSGLVTAKQTVVFMEDRTEYTLTESGRERLGLPPQTKFQKIVSKLLSVA